MKYIWAIGVFLFYYLLLGSLIIPMLVALINVAVGIKIPEQIAPVIFFFLGIYYAIKSLKTKGTVSKPS